MKKLLFSAVLALATMSTCAAVVVPNVSNKADLLAQTKAAREKGLGYLATLQSGPQNATTEQQIEQWHELIAHYDDMIAQLEAAIR